MIELYSTETKRNIHSKKHPKNRTHRQIFLAPMMISDNINSIYFPPLSFLVSCFEEAEKNGVPLFCAFNRRFDETHASLKRAVAEGEVGKVHMVKVRFKF